MKTTPTPPTESQRLQAFLDEHFDFDGLRQVGFWPKGMRRKDYEGQAKRICEYFGYSSVYEYASVEITTIANGAAAVVEGVGYVTPAGEYKPATQGLVTLMQDQSLAFNCPVCTCPNELRSESVKQHKCKGCKRTLGVAVDHMGGINIWEK